jgi:hypothetical protein
LKQSKVRYQIKLLHFFSFPCQFLSEPIKSASKIGIANR